MFIYKMASENVDCEIATILSGGGGGWGGGWGVGGGGGWGVNWSFMQDK